MKPNPAPPRKPEPSLTTLGRAKAKGTDLPWVNPHLSPLYTQDKLRQSGWTGDLPSRVIPTPVDDTAAPLTAHLTQWLAQRQAPPPSPVNQLAAILAPLWSPPR